MGVSSGLEPDVFVGRRVWERGDESERGLLHTRAHTADEAVLPDGSEDLLLVQGALDLVQKLLALLAGRLAGLPLEEVLDLGQHARGVGAALDGQDGQPGGRVARGAEPAEDQALELALGPGREEGGALHGADLHADADRG